MVDVKEGTLPHALRDRFPARADRLGVENPNSWKEPEQASTKATKFETLSTEEHLDGLWRFLGLSVRD